MEKHFCGKYAGDFQTESAAAKNPANAPRGVVSILIAGLSELTSFFFLKNFTGLNVYGLTSAVAATCGKTKKAGGCGMRIAPVIDGNVVIKKRIHKLKKQGDSNG
jgi:hypothetical protein